LISPRSNTATAQAPLRGVIFDRDGVLTHFDYAIGIELFRGVPEFRLEDALARWERWYRAAEPARDEEAERRVLVGFLAQLCDEWGVDPIVRDRILAFDYLRMIRAYPDARRALLAARKRGLRVGILSNFPLASLPASLRAAGFEGLFDAAACAPVIGAAKPDRRAYEHMLDALGILSHECLLIDDETLCVEGARAIGIHAYLLDRKGTGAAGALPDLDAFIPLMEEAVIREVS
jgi:putative hydrolase of the HAD superfamily